MPDFNIILVDYANPADPGSRMHLNQPEKDFIQAGVRNLFQRVATEGKARADANPPRRSGARRSPPPSNPVYNIIVSWSNQPPVSSNNYICYFLRTQSSSIIRRLIHDVVPEAQGLTTEIGSQSISEVYVMDQTNIRRQLGNEQLVAVAFHEFLHNRLEVPGSISVHHDVHAEDPTGYGTPGTSERMTGIEADDPETVADDERYQVITRQGRAVILTEEFDIDIVYASLAQPISQYIHLRTPPPPPSTSSSSPGFASEPSLAGL